jgi:hypothetical protein
VCALISCNLTKDAPCHLAPHPFHPPYPHVTWQAACLADYCAALSKALLLNLTHQQQKIRTAALQAVGALVPINPTILKEALPSIAKLNLDRSHQLREQVRAMVGDCCWLPCHRAPAARLPRGCFWGWHVPD